MGKSEKLKLFISYSHQDEAHINEFRKHIAPLKANGLIEDWHDRKILAGQEFFDTIDNNIEDADISCLFISANFLSSPACIKEKLKLLDLRRKKGVVVIPVILSACGWLDDTELSRLLALPTDGKPVNEFESIDKGWNTVYNGLKLVIEKESKAHALDLSDAILSFMKDTSLLAKAHSQKEEIHLDDIFVYPELVRYDDVSKFETRESSEHLISNFSDYSRILIAGEEQSGKTSLLKKLFMDLRSKRIFWNVNFFVIYGFLDKVVRSLGSDSLREIVELVCDKESTPASFIIKHGILMWYNKNLQTEKIADTVDNDGFSEIAKRIIRFMIVNHSSMHRLHYKEAQNISRRFHIPTSALQTRPANK